LRNPTGYLSIGELVSDTPPSPSPGPPGGGYFGRGPGMGKGRVFGGPWGGDKECDTFTCAHCSTVVFVQPYCDPADMGGLCPKCSSPKKPSYLCPECTDKGGCDPYEEKLKRWEARDNFLRDFRAALE
jgi:hypothetical protein